MHDAVREVLKEQDLTHDDKTSLGQHLAYLARLLSEKKAQGETPS
jgi:hypothetical protein